MNRHVSAYESCRELTAPMCWSACLGLVHQQFPGYATTMPGIAKGRSQSPTTMLDLSRKMQMKLNAA